MSIDTATERDRIMARLRSHYATRAPLPSSAATTHHAACPVMHDITAACRCVGAPIDLAQLQRLYKAVVGEFEEASTP